MKKLIAFALVALFSVTLLHVDDAEAKRFGSGMSFGKQRSYNQTPKQQSTPQKAAPANSQRGATGTGMMGMLGGLALGGLLGAMFFGGSFEGINLFDIVIFGILAWILFKLFAGRSRSARPMSFAQPQATAAPQGKAVTPDIDEQFFLGAAKDIFMRMQSAWDHKDMDEIRGFCTPEVAERIVSEMKSLGERSTTTEVATLDAAVVDSWLESGLEWVAVHFTAMVKEEEDGAETTTNEVQENWIFRHDPSSNDPTWYLAGIQQG